MEEQSDEDYSIQLPVFEYENMSIRDMALPDMKRAIDKGTKAIKLHSITRKPKRRRKKSSEKYKDFRSQKEFNKYIDDCYLLVGKAQFYSKQYTKAIQTFKYMFREYENSELLTEAQVWMAASYVDQKEFIAANEILSRVSIEELKTKRLKAFYFMLQAKLDFENENFSDAVNSIHKAINLTRKRQRRSRLYFVIAQMYRENKQSDKASEYYQKVIDENPPYIIKFNAEINKALVYNNGNNGEQIRGILMKMLKDDKNLEYRDQIYYALAEMDYKDSNFDMAVENYWKSTETSVINDNQKALSYLKLGDYYFDKSKHSKAKMCYDSLMTYLSASYPKYNLISKRVEKLTELVSNLSEITHQDSLQRVAKLSERERNRIIDGIIEKIKAEEARKLAEKEQMQADRNFFMQNNLVSNSSTSSNSQQQANWYFYNPVTVGLGKSEFTRKWGRRKLGDNWRRSDKSVIEIENIDDSDDDNLVSDSLKQLKGDPKTREYYLQELPLNEKMLAASNLKIAEAIFMAGRIYADKFNDSDNSIKMHELLLVRFPKNKNLLSTYYYLYTNNKNINNIARSNYYRDKIISEFKGSEFAKAIQDPNYHLKKEREKKMINDKYEIAFNYYSNSNFNACIQLAQSINSNYPDNFLQYRFKMLQAMSLGNSERPDQMKIILEEISNSDAEITQKNLANSILKELNKGVPLADANSYGGNEKTWEELGELTDKMNEKKKNDYSNSPYKLKEEEHYYIHVFSSKLNIINKMVFSITKFNHSYYRSAMLRASKTELDDNLDMVVVKRFPNRKFATNYFLKINNEKNVYKALKGADYNNFVISKTNYLMLRKRQNLDEYKFFFKKNYLQSDQYQFISKQKKNKFKKEEYYIHNKYSNHILVLAVPNKGISVTKLRSIVSNFDKDYGVRREYYDLDTSFVMVNNIGNFNEALNYYNRFKKDSNINDYIKYVQTNTFIINEDNYEKLYYDKKLGEYIKYFKTNFENFVADSKQIDEKQLLKLKLSKISDKFKMGDNLKHYFGILFETDKVDSKTLQSGIKRYNTSNLRTSITKFNDSLSLLVVKQFNNRKQAMIYNRAIMSNPSLFKPLEKTNKNIFLITIENLNSLKENQLIEEYVKFSKAYYDEN
ncbi:MAG: tetratricopeptide repeat protein [Marinifilaceae bacterium]|nr:tetratricopeptide repeat protein [Marinifilaceae bacterium]